VAVATGPTVGLFVGVAVGVAVGVGRGETGDRKIGASPADKTTAPTAATTANPATTTRPDIIMSFLHSLAYRLYESHPIG